MNFPIDGERLSRELEQLAGISEMTPPAVTRVVFSPADLRAREYVDGLCREAGLALRSDAVGNTFARWNGDAAELAAIGTGSHIDAIPNAGSYDGTVGVLGGLEAIRALQRGGFHPRRSIELLIFTAEEPTRFGIGCLGSRFLAGLSAMAGESLRDARGQTLNQVREAAGFTGSLEGTRLPAGYYSAFVELHIEQGPLLERAGVPVGVVTAIAAPAALRLRIEGEGGHAGAVLMPDRHDAFLAAAEIALALEKAARSSGAIDTVATTGMCEVFPGAINSIPSRVQMTVDVRDTDESRRDRVLRQLAQAIPETAERRGVRIEEEIISVDAPAVCDPQVVGVLEEACRTQRLAYQKMVSRAYHDSLFVSRFAPTAMLFIPCRGGVSHRPDEYASPEAIAGGAAVLAEALAKLSLLS
uniref:Amidase, hydantoinase/carbamoylase family n=1 Tax=Solibacter usitatus (strain Ellin6076) TaxID=234267 RepID=Q02C40_SOLUE